jgi:DNA-binding FrmR family transcriptional regulator
MFPEKEETLRRLEFEAVRLHRIQILVQEGAACTRLLCEINSAKKALSSVQKELLKYTLRNSLSVLQGTQDNETQMKEIRKIFELFSESPNF